MLAQFPGLLGTADPLQTWAGLSILSTSLGWEVSWLTSFPSNVILCFSAILPIYLESAVFSLFNWVSWAAVVASLWLPSRVYKWHKLKTARRWMDKKIWTVGMQRVRQVGIRRKILLLLGEFDQNFRALAFWFVTLMLKPLREKRGLTWSRPADFSSDLFTKSTIPLILDNVSLVNEINTPSVNV